MTALFLTVAEASQASSVNERAIRAACESGALTAADIRTNPQGRHAWRIEPADLADWVRRGAPTRSAA